MHRWSVAVVSALALSGPASAEDAPGNAGVTKAAGKTLLMHYMPWYQSADVRGSWGGHWTGWRKQHDPEQLDERGLPDIWSEFRPLIGTYDSTDADVLECQLLQMKIAGIDGVIVDWYGIGEAADYPANQAGSVALFDACGDVDMSFAVCYEDRTIQHMENIGVLGAGEAPAHLEATIRWLDEHWFSDDRYVTIGGRPLLLNFGPIRVKDASVWDAALGSVEPRPAFFALHHLWKDAGADGGYTWVHQDAWRGTTDGAEIRERLDRTYRRVSDDPARTIVSALPGFDDVYDNSHPYVPHLGGETMRASLDACLAGPWEIVQLVTWNDYGEGTMIEPTYEFGYLFLEIIQRARISERGDAFPYTPEDLRLAADLLEARRSGAVGDGAGDRVRRLILDGDTDGARRVLSSFAPEGATP
jgi:hypothetical protein